MVAAQAGVQVKVVLPILVIVAAIVLASGIGLACVAVVDAVSNGY